MFEKVAFTGSGLGGVTMVLVFSEASGPLFSFIRACSFIWVRKM